MRAINSRLRQSSPLDRAKIRVFRARVKEWSEVNGRSFPWRRPGQSFYRILVAEVLLQRTRAESVAAIYDQFFAQYPDWASLAEAVPEEMQELLRYLGLWKRRPPKLIAFAQAVLDMQEQMPDSRGKLEEIPAVGQYVASAALLFRGIENAPLLDIGMARVLERYFGPRKLADIRYDPYLQDLAYQVVDCEGAIKMNWAMLDLAGLVCTVRMSKCRVCPLRSSCRIARYVAGSR